MPGKKSAKKSVKISVAGDDASVCQNIVDATQSYENWLFKQTSVVQADIQHKHFQMTLSPFILLRATFYRFADMWHLLAGPAANAPVVLSVGDLHIENFGTWRDSEGRLVWGVNDFDETCYAPFTVDLVRLAVSAILAIREFNLRITPEHTCAAILKGYSDSIQKGGRPFVLAEDHSWLRDIAIANLKKPIAYWERLTSLPKERAVIPASALECLDRLMPERNMKFDLVHRIAGEGSLGRPRYTAIAPWHGGYVARDIKAMLPSAWQWARNQDGPYEILYAVAVGRAVRCQDPIVRSTGQWIGRRIAPDCSRIQLTEISREDDEAKLLSSMGWETANVHLGTENAIKEIKKFLKDAPNDWLLTAAEKFVSAVDTDWKEWKDHAHLINGTNRINDEK